MWCRTSIEVHDRWTASLYLKIYSFKSTFKFLCRQMAYLSIIGLASGWFTWLLFIGTGNDVKWRVWWLSSARVPPSIDLPGTIGVRLIDRVTRNLLPLTFTLPICLLQAVRGHLSLFTGFSSTVRPVLRSQLVGSTYKYTHTYTKIPLSSFSFFLSLSLPLGGSFTVYYWR